VLTIAAVFAAAGNLVPAAAAAGSFRLSPGETLNPGQELVSQTGGYTAVMQQDGNFVEYAPGGTAMWATNTSGRSGSVLQMQGDGNLVVYAPGHVAAWASGTNGHPGADLELQGDSNLVIYAAGHAAIWAWGGSTPPAAAQPAPPAATSGPLPAFPAPGVTTWSGPDHCGPYVLQVADGKFYNPQLNGGHAQDVVGIQTYNLACGGSATAYLETKVCGFFGCNWTVVARQNYSELPVNGLVVSDVLAAPVRSGINSYRLRLEVTTYEFDAEDGDPGIAGYVPNVEEQYSNTIKLTSS
jgi:hypothetical protein